MLSAYAAILSNEELAVVALHSLFWSVIGVRLLASGRRRSPPDVPHSTTVRSISSRWARAAMLFVTITMAAFYLFFALVLFRLAYVGPRLLPSSAFLQIAGGGLACVGIALMAWSYTVLHSFRLLASIGPDHQLCTSGPFSLVRHPVYLGIDLFYVGCFLLVPYAGFFLQALFNGLAYDFRARVEEGVMGRAFGQNYETYARRTYRLVPRIY
jgi:protein-S-isoprenylcysteine O-methyltransferase Ste14